MAGFSVYGQVGDTFLSSFCLVGLFLTWEPFCLFCVGKSLEVGVVSVAVYVRRNN